jgi:hypothetical protein
MGFLGLDVSQDRKTVDISIRLLVVDADTPALKKSLWHSGCGSKQPCLMCRVCAYDGMHLKAVPDTITQRTC